MLPWRKCPLRLQPPPSSGLGPSVAAPAPESPSVLAAPPSTTPRSVCGPLAKAQSAISYAGSCFRYTARCRPAKVPSLTTNLQSYRTRGWNQRNRRRSALQRPLRQPRIVQSELLESHLLVSHRPEHSHQQPQAQTPRQLCLPGSSPAN
jgi:hypothetical protein